MQKQKNISFFENSSKWNLFGQVSEEHHVGVPIEVVCNTIGLSHGSKATKGAKKHLKAGNDLQHTFSAAPFFVWESHWKCPKLTQEIRFCCPEMLVWELLKFVELCGKINALVLGYSMGPPPVESSDLQMPEIWNKNWPFFRSRFLSLLIPPNENSPKPEGVPQILKHHWNLSTEKIPEVRISRGFFWTHWLIELKWIDESKPLHSPKRRNPPWWCQKWCVPCTHSPSIVPERQIAS